MADATFCHRGKVEVMLATNSPPNHVLLWVHGDKAHQNFPRWEEEIKRPIIRSLFCNLSPCALFVVIEEGGA
jgi:hypothetical protein